MAREVAQMKLWGRVILGAFQMFAFLVALLFCYLFVVLVNDPGVWEAIPGAIHELVTGHKSTCGTLFDSLGCLSPRERDLLRRRP
jgi:hypothetical protein